MPGKILNKKFFDRPTIDVAEDILGKFLVRKRGSKMIAYMITEVEAYDGPRDKASHASRGRTARNIPMFGPAGYWYVYFTYGIHWMLNIVTGPKDYPAAILIRGVEGINGPARVTKALHINNGFNDKTASIKTGLWIEDRGMPVSKKSIKRAPRVGVDYAGKYWSGRKYRFILMRSIK